MFTGLITAMGRVAALERRSGLLRAAIDSPYAAEEIAIGASIAHDGCCLTVVEAAAHGAGTRHVVEIAAESFSLTTLGGWAVGDAVNLERSLRVGDPLDGHLVAGHVDGVGEVVKAAPDGEGVRIAIKAPRELAALIAVKGSIAVNGVSLTVNTVDDATFGVMIIPHTLAATNLGKLSPGSKVNLEADLLARYVARMLARS